MEQTAQFYNTVIDDVINSVEAKWRRANGSQVTLEQIRELWRHHALKACNIETPEPELSLQVRTMRNRKKAESEELNVRAILGIESEGSDSGSDMESADDNMGSGTDTDENEESDFFGSDLDTPDVMNLVNIPQAKDILTCHYEKAERKTGKNVTMEKLELCRCHFELNGVPRVIKSGSVSLKNEWMTKGGK